MSSKLTVEQARKLQDWFLLNRGTIEGKNLDQITAMAKLVFPFPLSTGKVKTHLEVVGLMEVVTRRPRRPSGTPRRNSMAAVLARVDELASRVAELEARHSRSATTQRQMVPASNNGHGY